MMAIKEKVLPAIEVVRGRLLQPRRAYPDKDPGHHENRQGMQQ
jgi:hypothetical protein